MADPIPIADDVCEWVFHPDPVHGVARLTALCASAAESGSLDGMLVEVERRSALDRLLPAAPSDENAALLKALTGGVVTPAGMVLLARAFVRRGGDYDRVGLDRLVEQAGDLHLLPSVFAELITLGLYDALIALITGTGATDSPTLRALCAARPQYDQAALNAAALLRLAGSLPSDANRHSHLWDLIIVPGYTPVGATRPLALADLPAARARVEMAWSEFQAGKAPCILVSGGAVHPPGTPNNEALMMREALLQKGVPADCLLVDPFARHSTTNLRNAGRMMLPLSLRNALIVTGGESPAFDQSFYFGHPTLSSFTSRCEEELGYVVGALTETAEHRIAFEPAAAVTTPNYKDPLDY